MAINASIQTLIDTNRKLSSATDINNLFYYFYGRQPTAAEKTYWANKTSGELFNALKPNAAQFTTAGYYKDVIAPTTTTATNQSKQATLWSPDGKTSKIVAVGSSDASNLQSQGWTLTKPTTSTTSTTSTTTNDATLWSPNGSQYKIVKIGSTEASNLQSQGWTLTKPSTVGGSSSSSGSPVKETAVIKPQ